VEPTYLSRAAFDRLAAELVELKGPRRDAIRQAVLDARQMGSIVENGDYTAAKEEERLVEDRITHLESMIEVAQVVDRVDDGTVRPGATVTVAFADDETETYLYGESAERGEHSVCTPNSPLGQALAGARAGDQVTYHTPSGRQLSVTVVEVR
jgi:transcription elongation factor GreA